MTLGRFITAVDLELDELTNGEIGLGNMTDYADGELALDEMYDEGITPRAAAKRLLADMVHLDPDGDLDVMDFLMER